jgi:hypothetical protein
MIREPALVVNIDKNVLQPFGSSRAGSRCGTSTMPAIVKA